MAVVLDIVGAGGIGLEFKERFEMLQYDQVRTIVLVIFLTVQALELFCNAAPRRLHRGAQP